MVVLLLRVWDSVAVGICCYDGQVARLRLTQSAREILPSSALRRGTGDQRSPSPPNYRASGSAWSGRLSSVISRYPWMSSAKGALSGPAISTVPLSGADAGGSASPAATAPRPTG